MREAAANRATVADGRMRYVSDRLLQERRTGCNEGRILQIDMAGQRSDRENAGLPRDVMKRYLCAGRAEEQCAC